MKRQRNDEIIKKNGDKKNKRREHKLRENWNLQIYTKPCEQKRWGGPLNDPKLGVHGMAIAGQCPKQRSEGKIKVWWEYVHMPCLQY